MIRDPFMLPMRFFCYIIVAFQISLLFGTDSGVLSGCPSNFGVGDGSNLIQKAQDNAADLFENCCGLAFICLFGWFGGIFPVLLIFPIELNVFLQVCYQLVHKLVFKLN